MATRKEINKFLNEFDYTEEQMEAFFEDLATTNKIIKAFKTEGYTWNKLNMTLIKQLPTQKEKDLLCQQKQKKEAEEEKIKQEKEKQEKEYYDSHFFELMIKKIDNNEAFTEREILGFLEYEDEDERYECEGRRWTRTIYSYIHDEDSDRWFCVEWEQGLTEMQENMFEDEPYEVERTVQVRTRTTIESIFEKKVTNEQQEVSDSMEAIKTKDVLVDDVFNWLPQDTEYTDNAVFVDRVGSDKDGNK